MRNIIPVFMLAGLMWAASVMLVDGICADVDRRQIHEPVPYVLASEVRK